MEDTGVLHPPVQAAAQGNRNAGSRDRRVAPLMRRCADPPMRQAGRGEQDCLCGPGPIIDTTPRGLQA
jgi:hypothetical protein